MRRTVEKTCWQCISWIASESRTDFTDMHPWTVTRHKDPPTVYKQLVPYLEGMMGPCSMYSTYSIMPSNNSNNNQIAFQSKAVHPRTWYTSNVFFSCDLDLDPMTLIYDQDLDIPKMYLRTKNGFSMSRLSKFRALWTDWETDWEMWLKRLPYAHSQVIDKYIRPEFDRNKASVY